MRRSLLLNQWITFSTSSTDSCESKASMRLLNGVSASTFLARFVDGCLSSGCSSAACLAIVGDVRGE